MTPEEITDEYIAYETRLASFHIKKRTSGANGRIKNLAWTHKSIAPASLARAGFFFNPSVENPDNVSCFLCHKGLDGWEAGDDPLLEHLKHASDCGWAIVAAIEAELGDYAREDPSQPYMKDARKATFAGRWPHESKKGWKCKTKQLADAGWKYTPTTDSDDMATCVYCQLALDGWEPGDKPLDEHYNRSPNCAFFILLEQTQGTKKPGRGKGSRTSKASRLSVQSVATMTSEAPSISEMMTNPEDSILTTASNMTQGGTKKGKARKATTKGKKTKAKKEEGAEEEEAPAEEEAAEPVKPKRGKKRDSTAINDSTMTTSEAPAPKKRATRKQDGTMHSSSVEPQDETEMSEMLGLKKAPGRKGTKSAHDVSVASIVSPRSVPGAFPDDDEIERQLEADLERPLSDDEDITVDSDSERLKASRRKSDRASQGDGAAERRSSHYAMFNPTPAEANDEDVEDELKALQAEMEVDEHEVQSEPEEEPEPEPEPVPVSVPNELHIPKKGKKTTGTRKISKQSKSKKGKTPTPEPVEEEVVDPEVEPEAEEDAVHEASLHSTGTTGTTGTVIVKKSAASRESIGKRGRGRPSKASLASRESTGAVDLVENFDEIPAEPPVEPPSEPAAEPSQPVKRGRGRPSKASIASRASLGIDDSQLSEAPPKRGRGRPSKKSLEARQSMDVSQSQETVEEEAAEPVSDGQAPAVSFEDPQRSLETRTSADQLTNPPSTPGRVISPAPSARRAAISPSQSPQSSDAENQNPSSKPTAGVKRVALAPVAATPMHGSPSKRNMIAGLRSANPWTELDVELVLGSPRPRGDKENTAERFLKQGKTLTSPEKQMTVEEWIYHNASEAEKKLKDECEAMVSRFESEGSKAMRVLEGLVVE